MIYGGDEFVRRHGGGLLNERQRHVRRNEAGCPRQKNGKVEQDANEGVPVVANLQRLDTEGAFPGAAGDIRRALNKPPWQYSHPQQRNQEDRHNRSQGNACPTAECTTPPG